MIEERTVKVYYAPTRERRYFSKHAAINAEAAAIIFKRYPIEKFESDTGHSFHIKFDEPGRYATMHRRLCRMIKKASN